MCGRGVGGCGSIRRGPVCYRKDPSIYTKRDGASQGVGHDKQPCLNISKTRNSLHFSDEEVLIWGG